MDYEYDVFISYRNKNTCKWWVKNRFLPLFKEQLEEAVGGRDVKIFFDREDIHGGEAWKMKLKRALACSKLLLPILTPSYFHSQWCTKEFAIIYHRQAELGFSSLENPKGLIFPIHVNDGHFFPECVKDIQNWKFHEYFKKGAYFEETIRYYEFQDKVEELASKIAFMLNNIPEWNLDWLTENFLEVPNEQFYIGTSPNTKPPSL